MDGNGSMKSEFRKDDILVRIGVDSVYLVWASNKTHYFLADKKTGREFSISKEEVHSDFVKVKHRAIGESVRWLGKK